MEIDRDDGRTPNQLRPLSCSLNILNRAHGSASWSQGDTKVLAAVYGPKAGTKKNENPEKASIEVIWKPKTGQIGKLEKECEMILKRTLQSICILTMNPNTTTSIIVQVVHDDGALQKARIESSAKEKDEFYIFLMHGTQDSHLLNECFNQLVCKSWFTLLPCAINASCAALVDAGIPLKHLAVAICCCLSESGYVILDPSKQEEQKMKAFAYLVFPNSRVSVIPEESRQVAGEPVEHGLITSVTQGAMSVDDYIHCLERGRAATEKMSPFLRRSLQPQLPDDLLQAQ